MKEPRCRDSGRFSITTKKLGPFAGVLLETAENLHRVGIMDNTTYEKITLRHLGTKPLSVAQPISGQEIR